MSETRKTIIIVRHGDYAGSSDSGPLSSQGREEMRGVRDCLNTYLDTRYGNARRSPLFMAFSFTYRALESVMIVGNRQPTIVRDLYLVRREDFNPSDIHTVIEADLAQSDAETCIIIAHGVMPAAVAEKYYTISTGKEIKLPVPRTGDGYLVELETGEIFTINPNEGIKSLS